MVIENPQGESDSPLHWSVSPLDSRPNSHTPADEALAQIDEFMMEPVSVTCTARIDYIETSQFDTRQRCLLL